MSVARHPQIAIALCAASLAARAAAYALEQLELEITAGGHRYQVQQEVTDALQEFSSGAIPGAIPPREYQAIRCDGPWGAMKYRMTLASGPGFQLRALDNKLLLLITEHSVLSEDQTIAAMAMHCIDLQPRPLVKSVVEIELERGSAAQQTLQLENGYLLEYRYTP
jgi:hypothetical protein